jgi:hypothetical protein
MANSEGNSGVVAILGSLMTYLIDEIVKEDKIDEASADIIVHPQYKAFMKQRLREMFQSVLVDSSGTVVAQKGTEEDDAPAYPGEYKGPRPIEEAIIDLANKRGLDPSHALAFTKRLPDELPQGSEGWFAVDKRPGTPGEMLARSLKVIADNPGLGFAANHLEKYPPEFRSMGTVKTMEGNTVIDVSNWSLPYLMEGQEGDIGIIAAQFGAYYRRQEVDVPWIETPYFDPMGQDDSGLTLREGEVFLGLPSILDMVSTHPERLTGQGGTGIVSGEEVILTGDNIWASRFILETAPDYATEEPNYNGGNLWFRVLQEGDGTDCGCVTAFKFKPKPITE